jgi:hypothetical protein
MVENASPAMHRPWLDSLGATVSITCALQCAAIPLLISVLPFPLLASVLPFVPAALLPRSGFDRIALAVSIALAVGSFSWGFRWHRRVYIFAFLLAALAVIGAGWLWVVSRYQFLFVVAGALTLAAGHLLNRRLCRRCRFCRVPEAELVSEPAAFKSSSA